MLQDTFVRVYEDLVSRPAGPLHFRFILQPVMAGYFAVRNGLKDSQEGKPAYFWALFVDPAERRNMLRDGWKSVGKIFILALVLDCIYQIIELRWFYPFEALLVAVVLAFVPYLLVRGPVNRIASACRASDSKPKTEHP